MRRKASIIVLAVLATGAAGCLLALGRASGAPALELGFSHYETNHGVVFGIMHLTNAGTRAASYRGHSFGSDAPFYSVMAHSPTGWVSVIMGFCGTEARPVVLAAGADTTFEVYLRTNQTWKVGISYSNATLDDRAGNFAPRLWRRYLGRFGGAPGPTYMAWSEPIEWDTRRAFE